MISLITMSAGNPEALQKTIRSVQGIADEIIFGDLIIFPSDREKVNLLASYYNMKVLQMPFDFIFHHGFGTTLNMLARRAQNDWVLYLNVGEVIAEGGEKLLSTVEANQDCNTFYFDNATDPHHWYRIYRKSELEWRGIIHEEVGPHDKYRPYHKPLFRMADFPKDSDSTFKAAVLYDIKEIVYFYQYMRLAEVPERLGYAFEGWIKYCKDNYDSMRERILKKGARYDAFCQRNLKAYLQDIYRNPEFEDERFISGVECEFHTDEQYLL